MRLWRVPRFRLWKMFVAITLLSVVMAYTGAYYRLSRRGIKEAADYGLKGFFYVSADEVMTSQDLSTRHQAQETQCGHNLKQIGLALHNYHDTYKKFPWAITYAKNGTPMHSWRVRVLPYIESSAMYAAYDFDEPWNGPKNSLLGDEVPDTWLNRDGTVRRNPNGTLYKAVYFPPVYRCPSAPTSQNQMCTNYVMLIDDRPGKPNGPPNLPGSVPPKFDDKSAVVVIEIADSDIHWMEPRDVLLSELSMKINDRSKRSLSSYHGGACVLHADGSWEILDEATTQERVRELLTQ